MAALSALFGMFLKLFIFFMFWMQEMFGCLSTVCWTFSELKFPLEYGIFIETISSVIVHNLYQKF